MKKRQIYRFLFLALMTVLILTMQPLVSDSGVTTEAQGDNLLTNPGFEGPFVNQGGNPVRQVAQGWTPWHLPPPTEDSPSFQNQQPEYLPTAPDTARIRNGSNAQLYTNFFATHDGGVYQQVSGITPGTEVTFSVNVYVWSSSFDDVNISEQNGGVTVRVGIDPSGGTEGDAETVFYSPAQQNYDGYNLYSVTTTAEASTVTVFVRSVVTSPVKNTDVYLDDAALVVGDDVPVPTEDNELPEDPTETPTPTATSTQVAQAPTFTPRPGQDLPTLTPVPPRPSPTPTVDNQAFPESVVYTVQPGDTVSRLAQRFESSTQAIISRNRLNSNGLIFVGQSLVIPVRPSSAPQPQQPTFTPRPSTPGADTVYVVQPGDNLTTIAARFNTTVGALAQVNGILNLNRILVGQRLVIPGSTPPVQPPTQPQPQTDDPLVYVVRPGDTLFRISVQFGVPASRLQQVNGILNPNLIFSGQRLVIR